MHGENDATSQFLCSFYVEEDQHLPWNPRHKNKNKNKEGPDIE